ncbi:hypothetical protein SSP531S_22790 [Streptomyces spongiicola]|uniref:Uncharacterized protein n=1 Tax=Streptomyces spongiicola TaxID=1690221 RepID=A0A2S1Z1F0_9ACTN|nr:hypothetical protein DDQ41_16135 [Streptomyces spongiicola]GBQ00857.1 hypothetical protein SSP531S_22790 [Streptomyces spongiicola]
MVGLGAISALYVPPGRRSRTGLRLIPAQDGRFGAFDVDLEESDARDGVAAQQPGDGDGGPGEPDALV